MYTNSVSGQDAREGLAGLRRLEDKLDRLAEALALAQPPRPATTTTITTTAAAGAAAGPLVPAAGPPAAGSPISRAAAREPPGAAGPQAGAGGAANGGRDVDPAAAGKEHEHALWRHGEHHGGQQEVGPLDMDVYM
jgi:hypothetical protein